MYFIGRVFSIVRVPFSRISIVQKLFSVALHASRSHVRCSQVQLYITPVKLLVILLAMYLMLEARKALCQHAASYTTGY